MPEFGAIRKTNVLRPWRRQTGNGLAVTENSYLLTTSDSIQQVGQPFPSFANINRLHCALRVQAFVYVMSVHVSGCRRNPARPQQALRTPGLPPTHGLIGD